MTSDETVSPPCSAASASDVYMGYADAGVLVAVLNLLLEAERAGACVAMDSLADARDEAERGKVAKIQRDEGHWCVMLASEIRRLGGKPTDQTGPCHAKAMAIPGIDDRLRFLNRGQAWVVWKLDEILPRVRDARLHSALQDMRAGHVSNIELMAQY